jgi:hypothetical protein
MATRSNWMMIDARDVRHNPEREDRELEQAAPGEQVHHVEDRLIGGGCTFAERSRS